jgi:hypothetical protein
MGKLINILLIYFLISNISLAQNYSIYGTVKDNTSGELLIGATIIIKEHNIGTVTNSYGFYSITLPEGEYILSYSFLGYISTSKTINLSDNLSINIELQIRTTEINEVVVYSERQNKNVININLSSQRIDIEKIRSIPAIAGEVDIIKSLQLLPGIQTSNEGTTNLSVRGGSFDQNLILLDEAPVYNPVHSLSFFSSFNPDAIKNVEVYKGGFPSNYGGRLSSVIDIRMKEGNNKATSIKGGIGLIASRLTIESPIIKDKSSFILSGRYSYLGLVVNSLGSLGQSLGIRSLNNFKNDNEVYFYDLNAKINYKLNKKDHLYLSSYSGRDHFYFFSIDDNSSLDWRNTTGTIRWNHIFNTKIFTNTTFIFSRYNYNYILKDDARHFQWFSELKEYDLKSDFDYYLNPNNHIKFGMSSEYHKYWPGEIEPRDTASITRAYALDMQKALNISMYIDNQHKVTNKLLLRYGLRYTGHFVIGEGTVYNYSALTRDILDTTYFGNGELIQFYGGLEPRISLRYLINESASIKASYSRSNQYQHLVSPSTVGMPTDVWLPANKHLKPQSLDQIALGFFKNLFNNTLETSIETYYRKMHDIVDYKDNAELFLNPHIESQILSGEGLAYGIEFYVSKNNGICKGWISYSLSRVQYKINGINNNEFYSPRYDKRHNLSAAITYELNKNWELSSNFKFTSGGYITIQEGNFYFDGASFSYYSGRNGYKLPDYHRLDIAATYSRKRELIRKLQSELVFGIYNIYNRKNIFSLFSRQDPYDLTTNRFTKWYIGIIPYITFNFKF